MSNGLNRPGGVDVGQMALYDLSQARRIVAENTKKFDKPWLAAETSSFDCMHYLGNEAIEHAAIQLGLQLGDRVIDVGSGFSHTGRYLSRHYGASVVGIELQKDIHELAEVINNHSGSDVACHVRSACRDFLAMRVPADVQDDLLSVEADGSGQDKKPLFFDHLVSFLCFLHIPDRTKLFAKVAEVVRPSGKVYIEDYFARTGEMGKKEAKMLHDAVSCPYLPSRQRYIEDLQAAGLEVVEFEDVTEAWAAFVHRRATTFRRDPPDGVLQPSLAAFYDTVNSLFASGQLGGCRITCVRK